MASSNIVKVLETCKISPPQGTVRPSTLPLTYFDLYFSHITKAQVLILYPLPCSSASTMLNTHIPNLKHSLSLALQHFYLFSANIVPSGGVDGSTPVPIISYTNGDAVAFTVAECVGEGFSELVKNGKREAKRFYGLVPALPICTVKQPVLAIQVTLFPNYGIGIGFSHHHGVADFSTFIRFVKTWASFSGAITRGDSLPPLDDADVKSSYDRSVLPDSDRLLEKVMKIINDRKQNADKIKQRLVDLTTKDDVVLRTTLVLTRTDLERLKQEVLTKSSIACSSFTVASAAVWVCMTRARHGDHNGIVGDDKTIDAFLFSADYRGRSIGGEGFPSIPHNYFGNCICQTFAEVKKGDLVGEGGFVRAAVATDGAIRDLRNASLPLEKDVVPMSLRVGSMFSVSGSPKMGVYGVDFGWGRPRKVELVSIDRDPCNLAMGIVDNRDKEKGGFEIGLVLPVDQMDRFLTLFDSLVRGSSQTQQVQSKI